jgi:hypothetical protein
MDEVALARLIQLLESEPEPFVLLERLWQSLRQEGLLAEAEPDQFLRDLASDERFELLPASPSPAQADGEPVSRFGASRLRLVSRPVTADDVALGLARNVDLLNQALLKAWENRPAGDAEAEQVLLEAMARTGDLVKEIQEVVEALRARSSREDDKP